MNRDLQIEETYNNGFSIEEFFSVKIAGVKTQRVPFTMGFRKEEVFAQVEKTFQKDNISPVNPDTARFREVTFRPFDQRILFIDTHQMDQEMAEIGDGGKPAGYSLVCGKYTENDEASHFFLTKTLAGNQAAESAGNSFSFPLYRYSSDDQTVDGDAKAIPNLNAGMIQKIAAALYITYTSGTVLPATGEVCFANSEEVRPEFRLHLSPPELLDYIYAVLYSPTYRQKYNVFLKKDFPRIPYPEDATRFWRLSALGGQLRQQHLLKGATVKRYHPEFPIKGHNNVSDVVFVCSTNKWQGGMATPPDSFSGESDGKVYINPLQYFDKVPQSIWNFSIGGCRPAEDWLKARQDRILTDEDVLYYQRIIAALRETERIMAEIDKVGW